MAGRLRLQAAHDRARRPRRAASETHHRARLPSFNRGGACVLARGRRVPDAAARAVRGGARQLSLRAPLLRRGFRAGRRRAAERVGGRPARALRRADAAASVDALGRVEAAGARLRGGDSSDGVAGREPLAGARGRRERVGLRGGLAVRRVGLGAGLEPFSRRVRGRASTHPRDVLPGAVADCPFDLDILS